MIVNRLLLASTDLLVGSAPADATPVINADRPNAMGARLLEPDLSRR